MIPLMSYEQFKQTETIKYGSSATSASANKAPLFIKNELNRLYNEVMVKFNEKPLSWDPSKSYVIGDVVYYQNSVYSAISDNLNQKPPSKNWKKVDTSQYNLDLKYVIQNSDKYVGLVLILHQL